MQSSAVILVNFSDNGVVDFIYHTNRQPLWVVSSANHHMVLLLNKPRHWTSFDVVKKLRAIVGTKKIGHAGTLDPLATGLLLVCTHQETKSISSYQALDKVYTGTMVLGKTTPSIDLETDFNSETPYAHITKMVIQRLAPTFVGPIAQIPPVYSAIKVGGERSYQKARRG